jgi:C1A family cysteine protease
LQSQLEDVKYYLSEGNYVIICSTVEKRNWWDKDDLILPAESKSMYYHASILTGYNDLLTRNDYTGFFQGVNSWGKKWGNDGKYNMSYDYFVSKNINQAWVLGENYGREN